MGPSNNGVLDSKAFRAHGIGSNQQAWNFSATGRIVQQQCGPQGNACSGAACLALANGLGPAVIKTRGSTTDEFCANTSAQWTARPVAAGTPLHQFASSAAPEMCLTSAGEVVKAPVDPWCIANNNMWRSNTDAVQSWSRIMVEVESMANQGHISRPGAW